MSARRDEDGTDTSVGRVEVTRRLLLRSASAAALSAAIVGGMQTGVSGQEATPHATPQGGQLAEPKLEWIGTLSAQLGVPIAVGETPRGVRLIAPVTSGTFKGPNLKGTIVPLMSGDWLLVRSDGVGELDVRATVETEDDALLYITYRGYLTPALELLPRWQQGEDIPRDEYYFAVTPYFETSAPQYDWLQRTVAVGIGSLVTGGVSYEFFAAG